MVYLGKKCRKFEKEFADYMVQITVLGLASGLDAITLSLTALDLDPDQKLLFLQIPT